MARRASITDRKAERYIKNPTKCPYCGDPDITGGDMTTEAGEINQEMSCTACGREWWDIYLLQTVQEA
jgi:hypothetical protein